MNCVAQKHSSLEKIKKKVCHECIEYMQILMYLIIYHTKLTVGYKQLSFGKSKVTCGFSIAWGRESVPLITTLFKGQLYMYLHIYCMKYIFPHTNTCTYTMKYGIFFLGPFLYMLIQIHTYVYIIYIYIEREREKEHVFIQKIINCSLEVWV